MNEEVQSIIQWFSGRELPTGHFVISKWESTDNLTNMVHSAIEHIRSGNMNSLAVLNRVKEKLEARA